MLRTMTPLYPDERRLGPLQERAAEIARLSQRLLGAAGPGLCAVLQPLLRAMNSYYTNKIEGQHTRPVDIERALNAEFDADARLARKQRIAVAHLESEAALEAKVRAGSADALYAVEFIADIHRDLFARLPAADRVSDEGVRLEPGEFRQGVVSVGRHVAPPPEQIGVLLRQWSDFYSRLPPGENALIGLACAHHRLTWIHPFLDGNGRVARLHSHLALFHSELSGGLWSVMRGFARSAEIYLARLNNADLPRRNDFDGRGPLSEEELAKFGEFFLDVCLDQITFMQSILQIDSLKTRLRELLLYLAANPWRIGSEKSVVKLEALEALHYSALTGALDRGRFIAMTGLGERTGRRVLAALLDFGVLKSATRLGPVAFHVPHKSLRFLFPGLWLEAE